MKTTASNLFSNDKRARCLDETHAALTGMSLKGVDIKGTCAAAVKGWEVKWYVGIISITPALKYQY